MRKTTGRRVYPSDLTDEQWALLEPLIPEPSTQDHLLAFKVSGANQSDLQGAKALLLPFKEIFLRLKHLWSDISYGGTLIGWLKAHLGWIIQVVCRLKELARGVLVPIAEVPDWEKLCNYTALPLTWTIKIES